MLYIYNNMEKVKSNFAINSKDEEYVDPLVDGMNK